MYLLLERLELIHVCWWCIRRTDAKNSVFLVGKEQVDWEGCREREVGRLFRLTRGHGVLG